MITTLGALVALVGGIAGGVFTLEARYATTYEVAEVEQEVQMVENATVQTITQLRCDIIIQRLNELRAKERLDEMTEYDRVRRDQLRAQWNRHCGSGSETAKEVEAYGADGGG